MAEKVADFALNKKMIQRSGIRKFGIVGCGSLGQDIAIMVSQANIEVLFIDISQTRIFEIFRTIDTQLENMINRWGLTHSEKRAIISRIKGSDKIEDLRDCDVVIETINTKKPGTSLKERQQIFSAIEAVVSDDTIITSNTATVIISELAGALQNPSRAIGMHFLYPMNDNEMVELIRSSQTSDETYEITCRFIRMLGKKAVSVNESHGNVSTRMMVPMINEACNLLMEGISTVHDIDYTVKQSTGSQLGPFELADKVGLDKIQRWMDNLFDELGDPKFKTSPVIRRLVRAGMLGERSGEGFYKYEKGHRIIKTGSIINLGRE